MNRRLYSIAFAPLRSIGKYHPKQDNLILFGARRGHWYTDCSRRVYEWMLEHRPDLQPVWITNDDGVHKRLKDRGMPVARRRSLKGFHLLMRARLAVTSAQLYDIASVPESVPDSLRIVFLGHGKSVKASSLAFHQGNDPDFQKMFQRAADLTDVAVSTSPFVSRLSARSNGIPPDRFRVTGYPRNDELVHPSARTVARWKERLGDLRPRAVVLYAPTWRKGGPARFFPFDDHDPERLAAFLEEQRILLLLRPHERDILDQGLHDDLKARAERSPWIRLCAPGEYDHVNHVLPFVDLLVTDYSSISNDYLLLDRPMVFIPYDHDEFASTQGFMYDYFETLPGPAVDTEQGFLQETHRGLFGDDHHRDDRRRLRSRIHTHTDGRATDRVVDIISRRLGMSNGSTEENRRPEEEALPGQKPAETRASGTTGPAGMVHRSRSEAVGDHRPRPRPRRQRRVRVGPLRSSHASADFSRPRR